MSADEDAGDAALLREVRAHYIDSVLEGRVFTLEKDADEDLYGVAGVRHAECLGRTDLSFCTVVDAPIDESCVGDPECWGCMGFFGEAPLTPEQTRRKTNPWRTADDDWQAAQAATATGDERGNEEPS